MHCKIITLNVFTPNCQPSWKRICKTGKSIDCKNSRFFFLLNHRKVTYQRRKALNISPLSQSPFLAPDLSSKTTRACSQKKTSVLQSRKSKVLLATLTMYKTMIKKSNNISELSLHNLKLFAWHCIIIYYVNSPILIFSNSADNNRHHYKALGSNSSIFAEPRTDCYYYFKLNFNLSKLG